MAPLPLTLLGKTRAMGPPEILIVIDILQSGRWRRQVDAATMLRARRLCNPLCSALFFEFAALVSRYVTVYHGVSVSNVVFLRGVIQFGLWILSALIFFSSRQEFTVPTNLLPLVAFRGIFGAASYAITYTALSLAPIGIVTFIFFLNPISTTIVSSFVLKEKISSTECYAALLSILGALLVANPTMEIPTKLSHDYLSEISHNSNYRPISVIKCRPVFLNVHASVWLFSIKFCFRHQLG